MCGKCSAVNKGVGSRITLIARISLIDRAEVGKRRMLRRNSYLPVAGRIAHEPVSKIDDESAVHPIVDRARVLALLLGKFSNR